MSSLDIEKIRKEFPILSKKISGRDMVYLDNTATSQTPRSVINKITELYENYKANVHRGVHTLSQEMTLLQEESREYVRGYINADSIEEIIFTRGTTESINLVAASFSERFKRGDEIILTVMEHHANIVPWQLVQQKKGLVIKVVEIDENGELDLNQYKSLFTERTVMASFCHASNVLGTVNPVKSMIEYAHSKNVPVLIDGAQASPHLRIDVKDLDCDFYVFSAHKMYGPTGIGVLYGKREYLSEMPPFMGGGEMISKVTFAHTTFADLPFKFEAGTPDFVGIAAFKECLKFIDGLGIENIESHEKVLTEKALFELNKIEGITIYGKSKERNSVISFLLDDVHPYDLGLLLDKQGIEVRTGHHCAMPLMDYLKIPGTVRASFALYNTEEEVEKFIAALKKAAMILKQL